MSSNASRQRASNSVGDNNSAMFRHHTKISVLDSFLGKKRRNCLRKMWASVKLCSDEKTTSPVMPTFKRPQQLRVEHLHEALPSARVMSTLYLKTLLFPYSSSSSFASSIGLLTMRPLLYFSKVNIIVCFSLPNLLQNCPALTFIPVETARPLSSSA